MLLRRHADAREARQTTSQQTAPAEKGEDAPKPGSKAALVAEAKALGLDTSGNKSELSARLAEAKAATPVPADPAQPEGGQDPEREGDENPEGDEPEGEDGE